MIGNTNYFNGINLSFIKKLPAEAKILDYGCGQGKLTIFFLEHGYRVSAADIDSTLEDNIRKRLTADQNRKLSFVAIKDTNNPLAEQGGTYDAIIIREVLEHLHNPEKILEYLSNLLVPRGLLILSVPTALSEKYFAWWDRDWLKKSKHVNVFSKESIESLLHKTSLKLIAVEGQSFKWSLFWVLLVPFNVNHEMGNPTSHHRLVYLVQRVVNVFCSFPYCECIGNKLFPKSIVFYARRGMNSSSKK